MTITVRRNDSGKLEIMNGNARLHAMLSLGHQVEVYDVTSRETMYVHEVDGELLAVSALEWAMAQAIAKNASKGYPK